jgi:peptidoglycan hydrolase-like protein with peptidoglycan-binding domain
MSNLLQRDIQRAIQRDIQRDIQLNYAPPPCIKQGATGPYVIRLQQLLDYRGFNPGPVDGDFGSRTHVAVYRFQFSRSLKLTGIVDLVTWDFLSTV